MFLISDVFSPHRIEIASVLILLQGLGALLGESLPFGLQFSCLRNRLDSAFCMETYVFGHEFVGNFVKVAVCCG